MAKLAIRGHETRGKEVIKILEMVGGENTYYVLGNEDKLCYFLEFGTNRIVSEYWDKCINKSEFYVLSLEDFLKKYPYKIGDKVLVINNKLHTNGFIKSLYWYPKENIIRYEVDLYIYTQFCGVNELKPYIEETMEEIKDNLTKWDLPDGYEFQDKEGNVINTDTIKLVKKQQQYPKTYVECAIILNTFSALSIDGYKKDLIAELQELLIRRDTYWKIAGEEMGLGKPWEPNWKDDNDKYFICYLKDELWMSNIRDCNRLLVFPTAEMRDAFYKNFKKQIEKCKELL